MGRRIGSRWLALLLAVLIAAAGLLAPKVEVQAKGSGTVTVSSALISGGNVVVATAGSAASDDGVLHLFAQSPEEGGAQGTEVAAMPAGSNAFTFALNKGSANSNLFKKFVVMAVRGGTFVPVSNAMYITNPEAVATHSAARKTPGKKGILPAGEWMNNGSLQDLGISQITYNLHLGDLCRGGGVNYEYNGKTYSFNANIVKQYDLLAPMMNKQGIVTNMIVLNDLTADPSMIHPLSRDFTGANYYAFNTAERAGVEKLEAIASFLGSRYGNSGHGTIENWIIGNEVNARQEWNYMTAGAGIDTYANEYAKAVRIFYNGIKSENAGARVFASVDQEYAVADGPAHYGAKPFLDRFNADLRAEGNIDWDIAIHPYNFPLYDPNAGAQTVKPQVTHTQASRYITMQNIDVFTDYMCTPVMLAPSGQVRSIVCSEVGYTSLQGEQIQAASAVYAYMQAMSNQHIDGFILNRQKDEAVEIAQGLAFGVCQGNGTHKVSYDWYKNAGNPNVQAQAAAVFGVPSLAQLITVR